MSRSLLPLSAVALLLSASPVAAADARSILDSAHRKQAERRSKVQNYTVTLAVKDAGGLQTPVYYEKIEIGGEATFRMVPPTESYRVLSEKAGFPAGKDVMAAMAPGLDMLGEALAQGGGDMPAMDLRGMTSQMSMFARAAATAPENDGRGDAKQALDDFAEFANRARLDGTERVQATSGTPGQMREAYRIVADDVADIPLEQPKGDAKFTLQKVSLWLDQEQLVPLRLLMEGQVESKGKKTPIQIEKLDLDYKQVGPLYESHRQVYRLAGLMANLSEKDRKQLEESKAQMEKAKAQLESMPAAQRAMVEKMMKSQMEKFDALVSQDAITSETEVVSIAIDEGPPTPFGPGDLTVGGPAAATYPVTLTIAGDDPGAELAIAGRIPGSAEVILGLKCAVPFPASGSIDITAAAGRVELEGGPRVSIEKATGTITVTKRTPTRIMGTFTAVLTGDTGDGKVDFSASGSFDTGAPVGPMKELRGSPIPADLFAP